MMQIVPPGSRKQVVWRASTPMTVQGSEPDLWMPLLGWFVSGGGFQARQITVRYAVHVFHRGQGVVRIDGVSYEVGKGDSLAYFLDQRIERHDEPDDPWEYHYFLLEGRWVTQALNMAGFTEENPLQRRDVTRELAPLFKRVREAYGSGNEPHPMFPVIAAWSSLEPFITPTDQDAPSQIGDLPAAALRLIEEHYAEDLTIDEIADRFQVDRSTLYRRFKESYGLSPKQALDHFRLARAAELLGGGHASVQDTAAACGFTSAHYFSRAFRKRYGMAPSAWKDTGGRKL